MKLKQIFFILLIIIHISCKNEKIVFEEEIDAVTDGFINNHGYVDLGLSVKWATCNVGAISPYQCGDEFAWGETATKLEYTEENCKTYGMELGDISGNPEYDAATAHWGGSWRMPTQAEFEELLNNCNWKYVIKHNINGYIVVSKKNAKSIFLPITHQYENSFHYAGYYWTSTPTDLSSNSYAFGFYFDDDSKYTFFDYRHFGCSIRPVSD